MARLSLKIYQALVFSVLILSLGCLSASAGEKKKVSVIARTTWIANETLVTPNDPNGLTIYRVHRVYELTSSDSDWNATQMLEWEQGREFSGNGVHEGFDIEQHKGGDQVYQQFRGTHKLSKPFPDFEYLSEGNFEYLGGTGKFLKLKGKGKYTSVATPLGVTTKWEAEVEY